MYLSRLIVGITHLGAALFILFGSLCDFFRLGRFSQCGMNETHQTFSGSNNCNRCCRRINLGGCGEVIDQNGHPPSRRQFAPKSLPVGYQAVEGDAPASGVDDLVLVESGLEAVALSQVAGHQVLGSDSVGANAGEAFVLAQEVTHPAAIRVLHDDKIVGIQMYHRGSKGNLLWTGRAGGRSASKRTWIAFEEDEQVTSIKGMADGGLTHLTICTSRKRCIQSGPERGTRS